MTLVTQVLLIVVVIVLTVLICWAGVQFVYILKEVRKMLQKMNKIIDDFGLMSESAAKSVASLTGAAAGLKTVLSVFNFLKKEKRDD